MYFLSWFRTAQVFVLAVGLMVSGAQVNAGGEPPDQIIERMGAGMAKILSQPERVEAFLLAPNLSAKGEGVSGYAIVKKLGVVPRKMSAEITDLAFDDKSHVFDIQKKCRFRPEIAYRFAAAKQAVNVLFSTHCKQWMFESADNKIYENFDPVVGRVEDLLRRTKALAGE